MEKVNCNYCKRRFNIWSYRLKRSKRVYCSKKCSILNKSEDLIDAHRGKRWGFGESHIGGLWNKGQRKYKSKCLCCNEEIKTSDKRKKYCSSKCFYKSMKGQIRESMSEKMKGNTFGFKKGQKSWNYVDGRSKILGSERYGDDWFKIRMLIYARDKFTCQDCGITMNETRRAHHIHHKIPFLISFDNSMKNLITLCPPCHRRIEAIIMKELKIQKVEV